MKNFYILNTLRRQLSCFASTCGRHTRAVVGLLFLLLPAGLLVSFAPAAEQAPPSPPTTWRTVYPRLVSDHVKGSVREIKLLFVACTGAQSEGCHVIIPFQDPFAEGVSIRVASRAGIYNRVTTKEDAEQGQGKIWFTLPHAIDETIELVTIRIDPLKTDYPNDARLYAYDGGTEVLAVILDQCVRPDWDPRKTDVILPNEGSTTDKTQTGLLKSALAVYPSPASGTCEIRYARHKDAEITVHNLMGQVVLEATIPADESQRLDISRLAPGSYLVRVKDNPYVTERLVVR